MTRTVIIFAAAFPAILLAQFDPQTLLQQARANIVRNIENLPKYTCVQTVYRVRFEPQVPVHESRCRDVPDARALQLLRAWSDRFKLDVTVADGSEIFSWAGASEFQSADAQQIVGGGLTGTGDFGPFLLAIFGSSGSEYQFLRLEQNQAVYHYHVPVSASHYQIKTGSRPQDHAIVPYEGTFTIDAATAELRKMTIVVSRPPRESETCHAETTIDYQRVQIGDSRLPLPQATTLELWDTDGMRYENRIQYTSCRAFQSESVFRPETDAPAANAAAATAPFAAKAAVTIPHGIAMRIALRSRIDGENAFAGDAIEGQLLHAIKGRGGQVVVPEGAVVHGRIVRLEQQFIPTHYFALGLKYLSVTANGSEIPLTLEFVNRLSQDKILNGAAEKRQGIGVLMIRGDRLSVAPGLVSEWKTVD